MQIRIGERTKLKITRNFVLLKLLKLIKLNYLNAEYRFRSIILYRVKKMFTKYITTMMFTIIRVFSQIE